MPSRSQWAYHRSGSILACLRSTVKPSVLHRLDVVHHRRVAGRGEQPVGPVALVEHADVGVGLAVEQQPRVAVRRPRPTPKERRPAYDVTRSSPSASPRRRTGGGPRGDHGCTTSGSGTGSPGTPDRDVGLDRRRPLRDHAHARRCAGTPVAGRVDGDLERAVGEVRHQHQPRRRTPRGRRSSQTVCQMPDWAVYQIVPRSSRCLPRACGAVSERSRTRTPRGRARPRSPRARR